MWLNVLRFFGTDEKSIQNRAVANFFTTSEVAHSKALTESAHII
jgi:hypothetical protein